MFTKELEPATTSVLEEKFKLLADQSLLQPSATLAIQSLLSPISPSVAGVDQFWVCCESATLGSVDPLALPPKTDPVTPPWFIVLAPTPLLLSPLAPPGTIGSPLVPPVPPCPSTYQLCSGFLPPRLHPKPSALIPPTPPWSVIAPLLPRTFGIFAALHPFTSTVPSGLLLPSGSSAVLIYFIVSTVPNPP
ncbi:hypothetical protein ROHU_002905 [Labeo rohita]|uniref:Uncharacterized protein n=1 Tax=Labeo rohita TaxID=84645 RepID=A0A498NXM5_LABRO|nr:hypothetical protein ROHU_002905 [Labeo rohita]